MGTRCRNGSKATFSTFRVMSALPPKATAIADFHRGGDWTLSSSTASRVFFVLLCQRFNDANVALGGVAQHLQCGLIARAVVGRGGFIQAVELDQDNALDHSLFVSFGGVAAGEEAAASSDHRRPRKLGVFGKGVRIGNRTIGRDYIRFGHCSPPVA